MYDEHALKIMKKTNLLSKQNTKKLLNLQSELSNCFNKRLTCRPKYIMEVAVLKDMKFPTPDAKYWQALLERDVQFQNLVMLSFDYREKLADILIKEARISTLLKQNTPISNATAEKLKIQSERDTTLAGMMKKEASERVREILAWTDIMEKVKPDMKYSKDNPEEHMPESFLLQFAYKKQTIEKYGASDMDGMLNIMSLGETAAKYWGENHE